MTTSCIPIQQSEKQSSSGRTSSGLQSGFALPQQKAPPKNIQSVQLYPKGDPGEAPIIELDSQQKLLLSFDYLSPQSRQFRVEVSHRTQDWERSTIAPTTYLNSFSKTYIQNSQASYSQRPAYQHVEFEFPGTDLNPIKSGNYLLQVYGYNSGDLLFSMPFFMTEDEGSIETRVETLYAQRDDGRPLDQLYSTYRYPNFVEYPQFDLSMSFAQNQFWGQMRPAGSLDTITPTELNGRLTREQAYIGNYEFNTLNLRSFDPDGEHIVEYRPGNTPPAVILRRDIQNLDTNPRPFPVTNVGIPFDDQSSDYARVEFSLDTDTTISLSSEIYIVGHFNNWMINDLNKMTYNQEEQLWQGHALIKQGKYAYKYVLVRDNRINDLALDQGFLSPVQAYYTFIYFKDPDQNFDRLLKVNRIRKR